MKNNKTCLVCGTKYTYCSSCSQHASLPLWMNHFHNDNCRKIYNTVVGYNQETVSKEKAIEILSQCDISDVNNFNSNIRECLQKLDMFKSDVSTVSEEVTDDEIIVASAVETVVEDKQTKTASRKKKK